ncbi:MAG: trypsin-like peptidase domain-containing protein [Deltaproteobacteria bacterium]|nr:trypsin-like peptidase domain-containing protein [Deltaproteobacteria bacterium]
MRQIVKALLLVMIVVAGTWLGRSCFAQSEVSRAWRTDEEERTIQIYKSSSNAVVFISTITFEVDPFDAFMDVKPREGTGSGFIIDAKRGIILTNLHVLQAAQKIEIILEDGQDHKARLLGFDQEYDIAVLQLVDPPKDLVSLKFGDSSKVEVGQRVLAIGNPFGLNRSLTTGIISSLDRSVKSPNGNVMKGLIQTDAAINPGNSGGPLLDMEGRIIGINTAILSQSGDSSGIGFAIPINQIKRVLPELIATGKVLRAKMGWVLVDTNQGPMVRRVAKGSPAEVAGVTPIERIVENVFRLGYVRDFDRADLIYEVNGKRVRTKDEVEDLVAQSNPREPITFTLRRGGAKGEERKVAIKPLLG